MARPLPARLPSGMSIRWDSLLVRHLAEELDETLTGARLRALRFDGAARDLLLFFRDRTLVWRLHPERGYPLSYGAVSPAETDLTLKARVRSVYAPEDERIITLELQRERGGRGPVDLIVELIGNQLNAVVVEGQERTLRHVLRRREGRRPIVVGGHYSPPPPTERVGADGSLSFDQWGRLVGGGSPEEQQRAMTKGIAWTSPLNAECFLAEDGWERWVEIARGNRPACPIVWQTERGPQPYPFALPPPSHAQDSSVPEPPVREVATVMDAFRECADEGDEGSASNPVLAIAPPLVTSLEDAIAHHERRIRRLEAELAGRDDPLTLRSIGDLILARYADIPRGADTVELVDFSGDPVTVELDPKSEAHENASRHYERAARSERAAERLPSLIEKASADRDRLSDVLAKARAGTIDSETVRAALPRTPIRKQRGDTPPSLPYRVFRSSGGLEIRVGRGARHNDDLTFRHSAPSDVWLHARHMAGAHVILRWPDAGAPPARDLEQAAGLAALHSKARTSSSVPVDWTLRKYVRKPRRAAPGSVVPERVKTVFVNPNPTLIEELSEDS